MQTVTKQVALMFMVLCLLLAAALRLPDLATAPPGVHFDEAANGILAGDIGLRGERPLFITAYTGKEVLFFYAAGGLMALLGESVFTLRLAAAILGLLTVAVTYWLGRELRLTRAVALLAAGLLAVSFWHLLFSRLGFRAISQPLLQGIAVAALLRGMRRESWGWLVGAGIALGLTAYTYLAARLFPLPLFFALLPLLRTSWRRWRQTAVFLFFALLALLPLLYFFVTNPETFWVRIGQVAPDASGLSLWESYFQSLGMLMLRGDPYIRFNLSGSPLFNWFWGGLLLFGWLILLRQWRLMPADVSKSGVVLLLISPFFMILPTALATSEIVPSNLRAIGLIPFIFYLPAIGLMGALESMARRYEMPSVQIVTFWLALGWLLLGALITNQRYFVVWAEQRAVYDETGGDLTAVSRFLALLDTREREIFVAAKHYQHPTVAFLSDKYEQVSWLPNSEALVHPANGDALLVYPRSSPAPEWALPYLQPLVPPNSFATAPPPFTAYQFLPDFAPEIEQVVNINFGNFITLLGYEVQEAAAGTELTATLTWRVDGMPTANLMPFVQLEDAWGVRWSQAESFAFPAAQWRAGQTVIQQVTVGVPDGVPPGSYRLRVGLFDPETGDRLLRLDAAGRLAGDSYFVENVPIAAGGLPSSQPQPPVTRIMEVLPNFYLLGFGPPKRGVETGETAVVTFWWRAREALPNLTKRLLLRTDEGKLLPINELQPAHGTYPFAEWETPQFVIDHTDVPIPLDLPEGNYRLVLQLFDGAVEPLLSTDLGPLRVSETKRQFELPEMGVQETAVFGNDITLQGYTLTPADEPLQYDLTLVWQALNLPNEDFTVFVHVLNPDGSCCLWQQDVMPQQGSYPTGRWVLGEVVEDSYRIVVPEGTEAGNYQIEVGLYLPENFNRLPVATEGKLLDDVLFLNDLILP